MKFQHNNRAVDFHEATGQSIRIAYWTESSISYGYVDLDEDGLGKLINWLRSQQSVIKKAKAKK